MNFESEEEAKLILKNLDKEYERAKALSILADDKLSSERISICNVCEHSKTKWNLQYCGICLCVLPWKTKMSNSSCPENKW